ncbi:unnamed protein product [Clavelina lepadiformis]|uniref:START domain-containing protein n=1 Tax=Clavelina lepadiformis TaxID=159417 RepID=A0ABP0FYF3_CLALP
MQNYKLKAENLEKDALRLLKVSKDWKYFKSQNGVDMFYKSSPSFNGNMYKFVTEVDAPCDEVYSVMKPPTNSKDRLAWDKSIKSYECLHVANEGIIIGRITTFPVAFGMVSPREFIDVYYFKTYEDDEGNPDYGKVCWIFAESIEYPGYPITKQFVRAANFPAGYSVAENKRNPSKSIMELYVNTDIGGMLPRSIIEAALPSQQVSYIKSIKTEVKRRMGRK